MFIGLIEIGKEYLNISNGKRCTVIFIYDCGDCDIKYKNGKKDTIHSSLLEL